MRKAILLGLILAGLLLGAAESASARCDQGDASAPRSTDVVLPDGTELYHSTSEPDAGFAGVRVKGVGYVQADGDSSNNKGSLQGGTFDGAASFKVGASPGDQSVCINDVSPG